MKPRSLLVLALVVAALGAFIWFVERDLPSTDERGERARKVLPMDEADVTALEIRVGEVVTRLEKAVEDETAASADGEWRLVRPLTARADAASVGELVAGLVGLEKERTLEDIDPAALGLAAPRATVIVAAGDEERTLLVGEDVPASSNTLVGSPGAAVAYVVADLPWADLSRPAGEWRSRDAFPAARDQIAALRLRAESEVALRRVDGAFAVEAPFADEARTERVEELLTALTGLEVAAFLDEPRDDRELGLDPAAARVSVTLADAGEPIEIALGAAVEGEDSTRYVALDDQRFTAQTDLATLVAVEPSAWRSTAWSRLQTYEVDSVEVRRGESTLRLDRDEGTWRREGAEIPYATASDLLYAVRDAEAAEVVDRAALDGAGEPLLEISLTASGGSEELRLYPRTEGGHPAERQGREPVLLLAAEAVDELIAKIEAAQRAEPVPAADEPR